MVSTEQTASLYESMGVEVLWLPTAKRFNVMCALRERVECGLPCYWTRWAEVCDFQYISVINMVLAHTTAQAVLLEHASPLKQRSSGLKQRSNKWAYLTNSCKPLIFAETMFL
jgi:hypothetical protein